LSSKYLSSYQDIETGTTAWHNPIHHSYMPSFLHLARRQSLLLLAQKWCR